jgi:hypothetical protein
MSKRIYALGVQEWVTLFYVTMWGAQSPLSVNPRSSLRMVRTHVESARPTLLKCRVLRDGQEGVGGESRAVDNCLAGVRREDQDEEQKIRYEAAKAAWREKDKEGCSTGVPNGCGLGRTIGGHGVCGSW